MFGDALGSLAPLLILAVLAVVAVKVLPLFLTGKAKASAQFPFEPKVALFTRAEANFLSVLRQAVPDLDVFGQVRLEDVINVKRGLPQSERTSARNRIKSRHLDFVLCEPGSTRIVCAVELDDASHASERARASDELKNQALRAAGVPLVRVNAKASYVPGEVARAIGVAVEDAEAESVMLGESRTLGVAA